METREEQFNNTTTLLALLASEGVNVLGVQSLEDDSRPLVVQYEFSYLARERSGGQRATIRRWVKQVMFVDWSWEKGHDWNIDNMYKRLLKRVKGEREILEDYEG